MSNDELVKQIMQSLHKCTPRDIGHILFARGLVSSVQSGDTIARRTLKSMEFNKEVKVEKIGNRQVFMLPKLTGYGEHDKMLTKALVILWKCWDVDVRREMMVEPVSLRPDAICLVTDGERKSCLVIEVMISEEGYVNQKINTWNNWAGSSEYLSRLFGVQVPYMHFCTYGKEVNGVLTLGQTVEKMASK